MRHVTDGVFVQGEQSRDRSCQENPPPEPPPGALYGIATERHRLGDPAVHAAADVERLLADAPALQHIVDVAAKLAPEHTAPAGEPSELPGNRGPRRAGGSTDQALKDGATRGRTEPG
jgi:hypothetical protein